MVHNGDWPTEVNAMCGISGIFTLDGGITSEQEVLAMTRALAHRGPDGEGTHVEGPIGFGHRRLAVLDLGETGNQPMPFADGRYWITYNGEIYNYLELKTLLQARGYRFRGNSDTEVVLAAYTEWGEACQLRFNGMWAFAIWDAKERRLFLSRDRFGVKPLFYFFNGRRFAFASEMKAFLPLPWFPVSFDRSAVACSLANPYALESTDHCLLKELRRLNAGHCLTVMQDGKPRLAQWWRTLDHLEEPPARFELQVEGFRERFFDAVKLRMRSDVPFAFSLSGGLDSSAVLGAATSTHESSRVHPGQSARPLMAFIASFPGTSHDEVGFAREVARYAGVETHVFEVDPSMLPDAFDRYVFQCEEVQSPNLGPWLLYRQMRQAGFRVSLEGHGGDELLAGYIDEVRFARDNALYPLPKPLRAVELTSILRQMSGVGGAATSWQDWVYTWRQYAKLARSHFAKWYRKPLNGGDAIFKWVRVSPLQEQKEKPELNCARFSSLTAFLFLDFHCRSLPTILRDFDRYSMSHGVEVRSPFLDWRVVCYSFSLPGTSVLGGGFTKRILREAMRGRLPERIRTRSQKIPFKSPMSEWWKGPFLEFIRDTVSSNSFLSSDIWDGPGLRDFVEQSSSGHRFKEALMVLRFVVAHRLMELFCKAGKTHDGP